jgi:hypothetical protein
MAGLSWIVYQEGQPIRKERGRDHSQNFCRPQYNFIEVATRKGRKRSPVPAPSW